jgi:uncharacterized protein
MTTSTPTNEMRVLSRDDCLGLLAAHNFGRLAVTMATPVIRPVNYVFDGPSQSVVFRTAAGSKLHALLLEAHAAFEIDGIEPASRSGWSVIIVGRSEEITNPGEIRRVEQLGLDDWAPGPKAALDADPGLDRDRAPDRGDYVVLCSHTSGGPGCDDSESCVGSRPWTHTEHFEP